jgi:hypothetical protein
MNTHADKTQENKSQSVANEASHKQSCNGTTFQFVDNRREAVAQRKLQEMANNSPQVFQLRAFQDMANNSPRTEQAAQRQPLSAQMEDPEETGDPKFGAKEAVDNAVAKAGSEAETAMGSSAGDETMMEYAEPGMEEEEMEPDAAPGNEKLDSDSDSTTEEEPSEDAAKLEAESEVELKTELDEKYPAEGEKEPAADEPVQRIRGVVQLHGPIRGNRKRAARARPAPYRVQPQRQGRGPAVPNPAALAYFARQRQQRIAHAQHMGAYRRVLEHTIAAYANYPVGSYGHGRWLYLTGTLRDLGAGRRDLLNFDVASIEVDHSPHDASQRAGVRIDDEASRHRVAVPLPRAWHRRHQTTHGPGATRHNAGFSAAQGALVAGGNYAQALENHLLDTFSDGAMGNTGHQRITIVAQHARNAVDYAQTNIPVSIFAGHVANTPAITLAQHTAILAALNDRIVTIQAQPGRAAVVNPF